MGALGSVGYFLISCVFSLVIFVLWARLLLRYFAINPFLPFSQTIYQLTNPIISPFQKKLASKTKPKSNYDLACFVALVLVEFCKLLLINLFFLKNVLPIAYLFFSLAIDLIVVPCTIFFYAIIIRTLLSWISPQTRNDFTQLLVTITEPLLYQIRRILPDLGMFDFSPLIAIILIKAIEILALSLLPFSI